MCYNHFFILFGKDKHGLGTCGGFLCWPAE
uniref:Uncharacterized protein n=1 Tax=Anguilla anguilla TaxID=7936 RepID=A0A0E9SXR6_ANGAN